MTVYFYSKAKQVVLYLLLAFLPTVGLICFYQALSQWSAAQWLWVAFWGLISAVFIGLFFLGLNWRGYIHTGVEVRDDGLVLHRGTAATLYAWEQIGTVKNWPWLQLLIIFDAKGQVLLPVDHVLSGFLQFKQALDQQVPAKLASPV